MDSLAVVRERAHRHQAELDRNTTFYTVGDLAKRWHCAKGTVRAIAKTALPYTNLGHGLKRELRRYHPDDVAAYEAARLEQTG